MSTEERCPGRGLPSAGEGRRAGEGDGYRPSNSPRQDSAPEAFRGAGPAADPGGSFPERFASGSSAEDAGGDFDETEILSAEELREAGAVRGRADPGAGEPAAGADWLDEAVRS